MPAPAWQGVTKIAVAIPLDWTLWHRAFRSENTHPDLAGDAEGGRDSA